MARLSYDSVEALIYDPVSSNRTTTRSALYALGFRLTESVSTLEACMGSLQKRAPDIVLCEAQGAGEELCAAIQALRQGGLCNNPFLVIIVTAWEKSTGLINRVVNSGADDLLLRPFSTALLGSRIESHIERRKGFVITTDYVGPDRRSSGARPSNIPTFEPPNSLKMRAKEKLTADTITRRLEIELKTAREKLHTEKLRRDSFQVCILWRLMQEQRPGMAVQVDLTRLTKLAHSIDRRCRDTYFDAAVEWCDSIAGAVEGLELGVDRNASMHLLGHASLELHALFHPEQSAADRIAEIDATVAIIRARTQTALAS